MKKLLTTVLAVLILISTAGCIGDSTTKSAGTENSQTTVAGLEIKPTTTSKKEEVDLSFDFLSELFCTVNYTDETKLEVESATGVWKPMFTLEDDKYDSLFTYESLYGHDYVSSSYHYNDARLLTKLNCMIFSGELGELLSREVTRNALFDDSPTDSEEKLRGSRMSAFSSFFTFSSNYYDENNTHRVVINNGNLDVPTVVGFGITFNEEENTVTMYQFDDKFCGWPLRQYEYESHMYEACETMQERYEFIMYKEADGIVRLKLNDIKRSRQPDWSRFIYRYDTTNGFTYKRQDFYGFDVMWGSEATQYISMKEEQARGLLSERDSKYFTYLSSIVFEKEEATLSLTKNW